MKCQGTVSEEKIRKYHQMLFAEFPVNSFSKIVLMCSQNMCIQEKNKKKKEKKVSEY